MAYRRVGEGPVAMALELASFNLIFEKNMCWTGRHCSYRQSYLVGYHDDQVDGLFPHQRGSVCERECVCERKKEEIKERRERERKIFYDPVTGQGLLTP